ncbi:MAG: ABC transporter ATP-binding protein [Promethearchaeota archaeon]
MDKAERDYRDSTFQDESGRRYDLDPDTRINIFNLYKVYKRDKIEVVALRGLNLKVKRGEFLMIVGASGCGKTTLLNIIGGLDKPTAGKIFIDKRDITGLNWDALTVYRRNNIGFIFQFMNLVSSLNAYENVELQLISLGIPKKERKKRVDDLLEMVGLRERRLHTPAELSGGEQQRVAIAAALAHNPPIIVADEPTGELDTKNAHEVMEVFKKLVSVNPEMSVVVVTHDPSLKRYADRIVRMHDGVVEETLSLGYTRDDSEQGPEITQSMDLEMILPKIPLVSEVKYCPTCKSSNIQITMLKSKNVEKPHEMFELKELIILCNDCQEVGKVKAKILSPK